ncbi:MAG: DUF4168 domain-containing protein [Deltaproteobacteria bacterium]|nr:DUF4168 domain-containing protein [Deltaproteobacteria bacterium]
MARGQETPQSPGKKITDKELQAFVKAYVEYQNIRRQYEPTLRNTQESQEREKLQREANSKIEKALKRQNLTVDSYNRIFTAVNNNEELRRKTLKMIDDERKRTQS